MAQQSPPPASPGYRQPPAEYAPTEYPLAADPISPQLAAPAGPGYPQPAAPWGPASTQGPQAAGQGPAAPGRRRRAAALAAVAVVVLGGLALAGWREHWPSAVFGSAAPPPLAWSAAQAPLPADAIKTSAQQSALGDLACTSADNCVGVGYYTSGNGGSSSGDGLIETVSGGTWSPAKAPVSAATAGQANFVTLNGVACPARGACVAVGSSYDHRGVESPVTETLSGTSWTQGGPPLPADADPAKSAFLSEVACPAPGNCVATGWYTDWNGDAQALIETLSGGAWSAAKAPLPAGATPRPPSTSGLPTALFMVRCALAGYCLATGDYTDASGGSQALIDTLSGGKWTAATAPLPADASPANPAAGLWAIACPAPGSCLAAGHYNTRSGQSKNLIEAQSGSGWTPAAAPLPAAAAANQKWSSAELLGLTAVACQAPGSCVAAGTYAARDGAIDGDIDTLSGGKWTSVTAPLPADAAGRAQTAFFDSATCPSPSACVLVGGYKTAGNAVEGLIETGAARH